MLNSSLITSETRDAPESGDMILIALFLGTEAECAGRSGQGDEVHVFDCGHIIHGQDSLDVSSHTNSIDPDLV
jgi:hypothetical protein